VSTMTRTKKPDWLTRSEWIDHLCQRWPDHCVLIMRDAENHAGLIPDVIQNFIPFPAKPMDEGYAERLVPGFAELDWREPLPGETI
jgi:hypothetical protein